MSKLHSQVCMMIQALWFQETYFSFFSGIVICNYSSLTIYDLFLSLFQMLKSHYLDLLCQTLRDTLLSNL